MIPAHLIERHRLEKSLVKHRRLRAALQVLATAVFGTSLSACAGSGGSPGVDMSSGASAMQSADTAPVALRRAIGLGPVVQTALGGAIFGWDINENGNDGVLAEAVTKPSGGIISAIETFDQTTGKIVKIVAKQKNTSGNHELVALGVVANDVGLIDDERDSGSGRHDIFHLMAPVAGGKFTGTWNPPHDRCSVAPARSSRSRHPVRKACPITSRITPAAGWRTDGIR